MINFNFTVGTKLNFPKNAKCLIDNRETFTQGLSVQWWVFIFLKFPA